MLTIIGLLIICVLSNVKECITFQCASRIFSRPGLSNSNHLLTSYINQLSYTLQTDSRKVLYMGIDDNSINYLRQVSVPDYPIAFPNDR
jgi:hypothetical protein